MRILVVAMMLLAVPARAAEPIPERSQRLAELGRIWGAIAYLHPYVWTRDVDWDAALLQALPKARAASSEEELVRAVGDMLAALHDPVTQVIGPEAFTAPPPLKPAPLFEWPRPGVLLVHLGTMDSLSPPSIDKITTELARAGSVLFDMRTDNAQVGQLQAAAAAPLYRQLITRVVRLPPRRSVVHDGYRPQLGATSGGYFSALRVASADAITPAEHARRRRAVFIVNPFCDIPDAGLGMQAIGDAAFVLVGAGSIDELLTGGSVLPIGAHHQVRIRGFDWLPADGAASPRAEVVLPRTADEASVTKAALALLSAHPRPGRTPAPPPFAWRPDRTYDLPKAPDVEHRLLALFRLWNVIDRFYPYKALLDERWDDLLPQYIARFEAAEGADAYAEVVGELAAHINDCHTSVGGSSDPLVGSIASVPFSARMIERQPVVVRILDAQAAGELRVGDVIITIDGEPAAARLARVRRFVAGSTEGARELTTLRRALSGAEGTSVKLTVRGKDGKPRVVEVVRRQQLFKAMAAGWRSGDVVRVLDGNIGYVDLDRLEVAEVDAMFDKLKDTRAILFDMRGYPHGTAWSIAPRLNVRHATDAAAFERPVVSADDDPGLRRHFVQPLSTTNGALYRGKTFMLVDERTISQSEHTGLFFEVAAGTRFIGSQSAGANGDVTYLTLPGGLRVSFTGQDVRHADGRQLQRVGLPLDVRVTPTIAGIQAGRDEVLERALQEARSAK